MAEAIHVLKLPQSDLIVPAGEEFVQIAFTPEEIRKAVQTGALFWSQDIEIYAPGKVSSLFFLKGLSFKKSKCGKPTNIL